MLPPPTDIWSNLTDLTLDLLKSLEEQGTMTGARHSIDFSLRSRTFIRNHIPWSILSFLLSLEDVEGARNNNTWYCHFFCSIRWSLNLIDKPFTPLLSWPINKNFDPRTGILHIVRDPQGIPKIPLTRSKSWGYFDPWSGHYSRSLYTPWPWLQMVAMNLWRNCDVF